MTEIPDSEKIFPKDTCSLCGGRIVQIWDTGSGDDELVYLACENGKEEGDGHTEHGGVIRGLLKEWGWEENKNGVME